MAPKSAMAEFRRRILKKAAAEGEDKSSEGPQFANRADRPASSAPETSAPQSPGPEARRIKRRKQQQVADEETTQVDSDVHVNPERGELNVLSKGFPYSEFMDKELMSPACLEQLQGDESDIVQKFQWAGRMLLKSAAIFRFGEGVVSSGIRAKADKEALEEGNTLLRAEREKLLKAKDDLSAEVNSLQDQVRAKDKELEEIRTSKDKELEEMRTSLSLLQQKSTEDNSYWRGEVQRVERLWKTSVFEVKDNILEQARVICPDADFSEIGLDKVVVDGRIIVAPDDDDANTEDEEAGTGGDV